MNRQPDTSPRPLIIAGMHRSGTSLTASLAESAGIDLGPELLGPTESNPLGHFEDVGFQDFHARALVAQGLGGEGYLAAGRAEVPPPLQSVARGLVAARMSPGTAWGWKDPRTTLFLDFWAQRLPQARYLFVFRRPWEVADSLFRRGDEAFVVNPVFAFDVWTHYNRLILDFARRRPEACAVFEISQVIESPNRVFAGLRSRLEVPVSSPARRYREELFCRDRSETRAALVRDAAPEAWQTYLELRDLAGVNDDIAVAPRPEVSTGAYAVLEWARASRAETEARRLAGTVGTVGTTAAASRGMVAGLVAATRRLLSGRGRPAAPQPAAGPDLLLFPRRSGTLARAA